MQHNVKIGNRVILGAVNGLGNGVFEVLKVYHGDPIHKLLVQGSNGHVWSARIEGIRVVG